MEGARGNGPRYKYEFADPNAMRFTDLANCGNNCW